MLNKVEIENYIKEFSNDFDKRFLKLIPKNSYFSKRLYEAILYVINVVFIIQIFQYILKVNDL